MTPLALALRSDERLALQVAGGNDAAFDAIYRRYEATLFGYCRSITRSADDAGDALQNAMLKALVALRREERSAPLRPWLFRIVHNEAVNQVTRRPVVAPPRPDNTHASVAGADEQAAARERVAEIVSDLRELPLRQRAALVMRELGDLDYPEIALALDVTENNARQLVFSARAGLKERQEGRGLSCDAVRDMILFSDARSLRRRPVRAHLRACAGCQEFAAADPRRPVTRVAGLASWAPIEWLVRTLGGAGSALGGAIAAGSGGVVVKAAATAAVFGAGLGVADVARPPEREPATVRAEAPAAEPATEVEQATAAVKREASAAPAGTAATSGASGRARSATPPQRHATGGEDSSGRTERDQTDDAAGRRPRSEPERDRARHPGGGFQRGAEQRAGGDRRAATSGGGWQPRHEQQAPGTFEPRQNTAPEQQGTAPEAQSWRREAPTAASWRREAPTAPPEAPPS